MDPIVNPHVKHKAFKIEIILPLPFYLFFFLRSDSTQYSYRHSEFHSVLIILIPFDWREKEMQGKESKSNSLMHLSDEEFS